MVQTIDGPTRASSEFSRWTRRSESINWEAGRTMGSGRDVKRATTMVSVPTTCFSASTGRSANSESALSVDLCPPHEARRRVRDSGIRDRDMRNEK